MTQLWALSVLLVSTLTMAQTYRWLDEKGNVHFSDKRPSDGKTEDISNQIKISNIDQGGKTAAAQLQQRKNGRTARQLEQRQENQLHSPHEQHRAEVCRKARHELSILQGRVIFFDDQNREFKVTEKERIQRAADFENTVRKNCA